MRGTGTEQLVVGMKALQWRWTEGAVVFQLGQAANQQWEELLEPGKAV
jgi:hypothetical protein